MWQRAAELDRLEPTPAVGIDSADVEEAAVNAGMTRRSVRTALAELRLGVLAGGGGPRQRRANPRDRRQ